LVAIRITDPDADPDLYRDTGKICLGGGMHCPSASSFKFTLRFLHFKTFYYYCRGY